MLYKIQHNLIDINRDSYIRHNDSRTRGQHRLFQERTNNETYRNSFFQRTIRDWNPLPANTVAAATIEEIRANPRLVPPVARPWTPCIIVLIVKIWNFLDVNRPGYYICVCLTRVASTELETVGNDSCSIPEEEEVPAACALQSGYFSYTMNLNFGNKKIYILKLYLPFTSSLASFSFSEKILKLKSKRQKG
jgi:hypothetical protein